MRDFLVANLGTFCFFAKFCNQTNLRVLISKTTIIFFIILACGYPNEAFSVANLGIFTLFHEVLQLDKSKGADFKYDNIVLKFQLKNTQVRYFGPKSSFFCFFMKLCNQTNSSLPIPNMATAFLKFQLKNTKMRHFQLQIQIFLLFHGILQLDKFKEDDLKYDNIVFKLHSKIPK